MTSEIIDQAGELEEMMREQAIAAHRINRNAVSVEHCAECGEDIPAPRRAAVPGYQTCADCQERKKRKLKHVK
ncbi:TraR/DksA C4-type zinc finger protein [Citrobacter koseri]|uniref:TraR/DksA C4-type zinc finger protein n=1 Tax=Citrobacter koseri TaxID=545 RepID=UPI0040433527